MAGFIPVYYTAIDSPELRRYAEKLAMISSLDPYEVPRSEWKDDIDLWPSCDYSSARRNVPDPGTKPVHR